MIEYSVRRRYKDFEWLHNKLKDQLKVHIQIFNKFSKILFDFFKLDSITKSTGKNMEFI